MDPLARCSCRQHLLQLLEAEARTTGAEIGVEHGYFALKILQHWPGCRMLFLIDLWRHQPEGYRDGCNAPDAVQQAKHDACVRRLQPFRERVTVVRDWSHNAVQHFADASLDFVYIDANHAYMTAAQDVRLWYPKVTAGGILAGHDFFNGDLRSYGVKKAVEEFAAERRLTVYQTTQQVVDGVWEGLSWMIRKSDGPGPQSLSGIA